MTEACVGLEFDFPKVMAESNDGGRQLQSGTNSDTCFCPIDVSESDLRLPTEEEFQIIYDDSIQFLREEGLVV